MHLQEHATLKYSVDIDTLHSFAWPSIATRNDSFFELGLAPSVIIVPGPSESFVVPRCWEAILQDTEQMLWFRKVVVQARHLQHAG